MIIHYKDVSSKIINKISDRQPKINQWLTMLIGANLNRVNHYAKYQFKLPVLELIQPCHGGRQTRVSSYAGRSDLK